MTEATSTPPDRDKLQEMIAETDTGARNPTGAIPKTFSFSSP
jgi:hypothetical protein